MVERKRFFGGWGGVWLLGFWLLARVLPAIGGECPVPATIPVAAAQFPALVDELDTAGLEEAAGASLAYLRKQPASQTYRLCGGLYNPEGLIATLESFLALSRQATNSRELGPLLRDNFELCQSAGREGTGEMLVTGYFEPLLAGSLVRDEEYRYPLYRVPEDLPPEPAAEGPGAYWSRAEIEGEGRLAGEELIYLADPVAAFILQVQGSGQVRERDGTLYRLAYAANNGRPYRSIGRLLVEEGKIPLAEADLPAISRYLQAHPGERERILNYNERYTFFRLTKVSPPVPGPVGSMGEPLSPGRSLAVDRDCFPLAALAFLESQKPVLTGGEVSGWTTLQRFVLSQDSGAAIKGPGRADLFWGNGPYAEGAAGAMKHPGKLYFLVKKREAAPGGQGFPSQL